MACQLISQVTICCISAQRVGAPGISSSGSNAQTAHPLTAICLPITLSILQKPSHKKFQKKTVRKQDAALIKIQLYLLCENENYTLYVMLARLLTLPLRNHYRIGE